MSNILDEFIDYCNSNNIEKAKELYNKNTININIIKYDTNTSDVQGPYNIFECMCIKNNLNIIKWFIELGIESIHYNNGFISACQYNHLELAQYIFDNKKDIELDFQTAFILCCHVGNLELLKWLHINSNTIDIHIHNETPFLYAIAEGKLEIAKWLYHISIMDTKIIDIHADNDYAFIYACYLGRLDICKWLYLISNNRLDKKMNDNAPLKSAKLNGNDELIKWLENIDKV